LLAWVHVAVDGPRVLVAQGAEYVDLDGRCCCAGQAPGLNYVGSLVEPPRLIFGIETWKRICSPRLRGASPRSEPGAFGGARGCRSQGKALLETGGHTKLIHAQAVFASS